MPQLMIGVGGVTTTWTDFMVDLIYLLAGGYLVNSQGFDRYELLGLVGALGAILVWSRLVPVAPYLVLPVGAMLACLAASRGGWRGVVLPCCPPWA